MFDPKAYEDTVVKPLRRWSGRELPDDLVTRYAVDLTMTDDEVAARLGEVRAQWHKGAQSTGKAASVRSLYKAFLRADEELRHDHGDQLGMVAWWREYERGRAAGQEGRVDELAQTLRASFGELGLVSPSQLEATVRAGHAVLTPDEVDLALGRAGIARVTPLDLPTSSGLPDIAYRAFRQHVVDARVGSVAELLFGPLDGFRLLDGFVGRPAQPSGLSEAAVRRAVDRENRRAAGVSQPARAALGVLATAVRDGVDLWQVALFQLLDGVRRHHAQGAPAVALVKQLVAVGLDEDEARTAVFSVRNESAVASSGLRAVRELLEDGRLIAAKQALGALSAEDAAAGGELVERQFGEVRRLCVAADAALAGGDDAGAAGLLRQAAALAVDDEDLAARLGRIPAAPVSDVVVQPDGGGVRVSWRPAPSHDAATRYRVVRKAGRIPVDPTDGQAVREDTGTVAVDLAVPAGRPVGYAVFAADVAGPWSRPVGANVEVVPPVFDVRLTEDGGVITGRWQLHPEARSVVVTRADRNGPLWTSGRTSFRDTAVGADPVYTLVAVYRDEEGREIRSAAVTAQVSSARRLEAVGALVLAPAGGAEGLRVVVRWQQSPDADVVIRRASESCPWEFGAVVPVTDLAGYGDEVLGVLDVDDDWRVLTAKASTGLFHYVPFTVGPAGAVRGAGNALGIALPVTGLRYQRFGDDVGLSWIWPDGVGLAEVAWGGRRIRLTRERYRTDGGCRIRCDSGEVRVRGVVGDDCFSPEAVLVVPERPPSVRYAVDLTRRPLRGAVARVRLTADADARCTVVVVAAPGVVMPRRSGDGMVVLRGDHELVGGVTLELMVELPRMSRPYWVRCFLDDDPATVRLVDPPVGQLKVP